MANLIPLTHTHPHSLLGRTNCCTKLTSNQEPEAWTVQRLTYTADSLSIREIRLHSRQRQTERWHNTLHSLSSTGGQTAESVHPQTCIGAKNRHTRCQPVKRAAGCCKHIPQNRLGGKAAARQRPCPFVAQSLLCECRKGGVEDACDHTASVLRLQNAKEADGKLAGYNQAIACWCLKSSPQSQPAAASCSDT